MLLNCFMTNKITVIFYLVLSLLLNSNAFALNGFEKQINGFIGQSSQKKVSYGVKIIEADSGKAVYISNAEKAMIPASNMKIITTAAAIHFLGDEFEYVTKIGLSGNSLIVIGSGDPLLGDWETDVSYGRAKDWIFSDIKEKIEKSGQSSVENIIVDSTVFDDQRVNPNWPREQLNQWYACEVCGLNYNRNCVEMTVKRVGSVIDVVTEPATDYLTISNKVRLISSGSGAVGAYRIGGKPNHLVVKGKCRKAQGPFEVAIERPAAFFGFLVYENLTKNGISVKGNILERSFDKDSEFKLLAEYKTSLADCLRRANKDSLGAVAEALLKTMGCDQNSTKIAGSWESGRQRISEYLNGLGIESEKFIIDDGSGLSRDNRLCAEVICLVLSDMYKKPTWTKYKESLALGGVDGTIKKYFTEPKYKGMVFGKTGYISGTKSFSGYCDTPSGGYIFSIIANNANGSTRYVINNIVKAIFDKQ